MRAAATICAEMRSLALISALSGQLLTMAQVVIDKPLVLTGAAEDQRQVIGLPADPSPDAAISARQDQSNVHRFAMASGGSVWSIVLPALIGGPSAGTYIVVRAPSALTADSVSLIINGQGPYPVIMRPGEPLLGTHVAADQLLSLVFDGDALQVMSGIDHRRRVCPTGLTAVNDQYCIEPDERTAESFYDAARICTESGLRLCTWAEWHSACLLATGLGLQNMTGNWEYTDDTANEDGTVRIIGMTCTQATTWLISNGSQTYRCCYTR